MKFKDRNSGFFKSKKINVFLIFLLLSFSFLVLTKLSKTYTQIITFNIVKRNISQEKIIVDDSTHKLEITIRTHGFKLLKYFFYKPNLQVDFSQLDKNATQYLWINRKNNAVIINQFDANVEVVSINPDTLFFNYDENHIKTVPIQLHKEFDYAVGYDLLGDISLTPDSIKVIGPKILIDTIKYVGSHVLKLQNINSNISTSVKLKLSKTNKQIKYSHDLVLVNANVNKFTEGVFDVPVEVINVPKNVSLSYFPKIVKVYFYTNLKNFNKIGANDFKVECDYKSINESIDFLTPIVVLKPKSVKNVRINIEKIEYIITQ